MSNWVHMAPVLSASFLASLVEFVEALTVVLAVGTVRGWRPALAGAAAGTLSLAVAVAVLGSLLVRIPLVALQIVVGVLLLLFGLRWLRKAILRAAGVIALHDEAAAYARQTEAMRHAATAGGFDTLAFGTAFEIVVLEGLEVVFIVIAMGSGGQGLLMPVLGAVAAFAVVMILGAVLHRPLAQIPENALKFCVGVILSGFGTFWTGEGLGIAWPGGDGAVLALVGGFLIVALALVRVARERRPGRVET